MPPSQGCVVGSIYLHYPVLAPHLQVGERIWCKLWVDGTAFKKTLVSTWPAKQHAAYTFLTPGLKHNGQLTLAGSQGQLPSTSPITRAVSPGCAHNTQPHFTWEHRLCTKAAAAKSVRSRLRWLQAAKPRGTAPRLSSSARSSAQMFRSPAMSVICNATPNLQQK